MNFLVSLVFLSSVKFCVTQLLANFGFFGFQQSKSRIAAEDAFLDVPDLIRKHGYPAEEHRVITEDGYILALHRIPRGINGEKSEIERIPVYIVHSACSSSADFVLTGPSSALAFILADAGYDVWLANGRGNFYSRNHLRLNPDKDPEFWNFSWDELGNFDHPASIDYILNTTGHKQLHYIGHSQGSTTFFVMSSLKPEYNDKIVSAQAFAGPVFFKDVNGFWRLLSSFLNEFKRVTRALQIGEIYPRMKPGSGVINRLCYPDIPHHWLCYMYDIIQSQHSKQISKRELAVIKAHSPSGCTTRQVIHYGQIFTGDFRRYNQGKKQNRIIFGSDLPPKYDLSKVNASVYLYYSKSDLTSSEKDIYLLADSLTNCKSTFKIQHPDFRHTDFVYGRDAKNFVYGKMIGNMKDSENEENLS